MSSTVTTTSADGPKKDGSKMMKSLIAGAGSGTITKTCIAPLERAKILLQIQVRAMPAEYHTRGICTVT